MSINSVFGISIDCADAAALAGFWSEALGRSVSPGATSQFAMIDSESPAKEPRLMFHQVPEGKTVKNRLHLDLVTQDGFQDEGSRLLSLGASRVRDVEHEGTRWTTFTDPEGNEFDLLDM